MKNILGICCTFTIVFVLFIRVVADTIRFKACSVLRGLVVGLKDQQFTLLLVSATLMRLSGALIYVEDFESIEFDSATTAAASGLANEDSPSTGSTTGPSQPQRTNPSTDPDRTPARTDTGQPSASGSPTFFTIRVAVRADNTNNGW